MRFLTLVLVSLGAAAPALAGEWGEINCAKARAADETAICKSIDLVQRDAQMSVEFGLLKGFVGMGQRGVLIEDQKAWLAKRQTCSSDKACLKDAYKERMTVLEAGLDAVKSHGPF